MLFRSLLSVKGAMEGTIGADRGKFFGADIDLSLVNPKDGSERVTAAQILAAINNGKYLFEPAQANDDESKPGTGFLQGSVAGGLGLNLELTPDGLIGGLSGNSKLGSVAIRADSPNWLIAAPIGGNPFQIPNTETSLQDAGLTIDLPNAVMPKASSGVLSKDLVFILSQQIDGQTFATPVRIKAAATSGHSGLGDLVSTVKEAVETAGKRIETLANQALNRTNTKAASVAVTSGANSLQLKSSALNSASTVTVRSLFLDVSYTKPDGLEALLDSLKNLSFDDVLEILRVVVDMLQRLEGVKEGSPAADFFAIQLPVIERSIGDLVNLSDEFIDFIDALAENPSGSLQALEAGLRELLGLPAGPPVLSLDTDRKILFFDIDLDASASTTLPFSLELDDIQPEVLNRIVGLGASGNLGVEADVDLDLKLGLDLEGDDKGFFVDTTQTMLKARAQAFGRNLNFNASLGPLGVFVRDGAASIDGNISLALTKATDINADGRLYLLGFDGNKVNTKLDDIGEILKTDASGLGSVTLPLFYGLESNPVAMGNPDQIRDFSTGENTGSKKIIDPLSSFTALPGNALGIALDVNKLFANPNSRKQALEVRLPDFNFNSISLPSLSSLLSDPKVLIKGLNFVLEQVQEILNGEVFGADRKSTRLNSSHSSVSRMPSSA